MTLEDHSGEIKAGSNGVLSTETIPDHSDLKRRPTMAATRIPFFSENQKPKLTYTGPITQKELAHYLDLIQKVESIQREMRPLEEVIRNKLQTRQTVEMGHIGISDTEPLSDNEDWEIEIGNGVEGEAS